MTISPQQPYKLYITLLNTQKLALTQKIGYNIEKNIY